MFSRGPDKATTGATSQQQDGTGAAAEHDELARTAGLLIDAVSHEANPKFKQSQFLSMMRQLRDHEVVVEGNQMVEVDPAVSSSRNAETADVKGKGKATPFASAGMNALPSYVRRGLLKEDGDFVGVADTTKPYSAYTVPDALAQVREEENANDAYFRQENEEYMQFMNEMYADQYQHAEASAQQGEWGALQESWDRFEATNAGIRRLSEYAFTANNPYLLGEASRTTKQHMMHAGAAQQRLIYEVRRHKLIHPHASLLLRGFLHLFYQSVLEIEAAVQRDPSDALAWFELGVKQQENEREAQAIAALQRALALDPAHLPAWLALAVSYTNEGNRPGSFDAIREWVKRNGAYELAVGEYRRAHPERDVEGAPPGERMRDMIECLIGMARSMGGGEVDADIQVALAVLLNNNEVRGG
jgi:peroxin-5